MPAPPAWTFPGSISSTETVRRDRPWLVGLGHSYACTATPEPPPGTEFIPRTYRPVVELSAPAGRGENLPRAGNHEVKTLTGHPEALSAGCSRHQDGACAGWKWSSTLPSDHLAFFYEQDKALVDALASFVSAGLDGGEVCIVIATEAHRVALDERLAARGIHVRQINASGRFIALDAHSLLASLLVDGMPDADLFAREVGSVVAGALQSGRPVRALGEMAALLWCDGNFAGALRLEELWTDLLRSHRFCLVCAYAISGCDGAEMSVEIEAVCTAHRNLIPGESLGTPPSGAEQMREIALLRQKARSLEREVARRKAAMEALDASEARYRTIVETALEGIWVVDADFRTSFVNRCMAEMLGFAPDEMIGRSVEEFMTPEEQSAFAARREELMEARRVMYQGYLVRKNGQDLWVQVAATPTVNAQGQFTGAVAMMTDITERIRWELERSRLAAIVDSSEDAIVSKDLNGIVTSWNAAAERMYGWKAEEIVGRSKALVIPPDLPNELSTILERIRAGQRIEHYETRRLHKDRHLFDVSVSVSPIRDALGRIVGASTIVRDITERRERERELRTKQLEALELNQRLQRAMLETHHRVRNNLQMIAAFVDMQACDQSGLVPTVELKRIGGQVQALATVHDLLTREAKATGEAAGISARDLLERLVASLGVSAPGRTLTTQFEDAPLTIRQGTALAIVANELLTNAVKYSRGAVEIRFSVAAGRAILEVLDDGEGFPRGFDALALESHGLDLVHNITRWDLQGDVRIGNRCGGGGQVVVSVPVGALPRS